MEIKESGKTSSPMPPFSCVCLSLETFVCVCACVFESVHVSWTGLCAWRGEGVFKGLFTLSSPNRRLLKMMSLKF